jgi:protein-L-isoaspartate(D-aspartate) O-methyltransferase
VTGAGSIRGWRPGLLGLLAMSAPSCATQARIDNDRMVDGLHATAAVVGGLEGDPWFRAAVRAERSLPREWFVPRPMRPFAYMRQPIGIGFDQTISDPYVVAVMTAAARVRAGANVLEVGTGSGYQAAVLSRLGARVATIEIVPGLAARAQATLRRHDVPNVSVRRGDGYAGWPSRAPFDAIIVTAGVTAVPQPLLDQLAMGGRLVIPVGPTTPEEQILVYERKDEGVAICSLGPISFVPFTGAAQERNAATAPDPVQPFCRGRAVT